MPVVENKSTGKRYDCTKEQYDKFYKGKLNWKLISDKDQNNDQVIENKTVQIQTISKPTEETNTSTNTNTSSNKKNRNKFKNTNTNEKN